MSGWFKGAALVALCMMTSLAPVEALAQDDEAKQRMLEMSKRAEAAFSAGEYERAAGLFAEAYRVFPDRVLVKNEMIAWYQAKRCDEALRTGDEFLRRTPLNPKTEVDRLDRRDAMTVVAKCQIEFAQKALQRDDLDEATSRLDKADVQDPLADDEATIATMRTRIETRRAEIAASNDIKDPNEGKDPADPEVPKKEGRLGPLGSTGIGLLAGGVVLVGYGITEVALGAPKLTRLREDYADVALGGDRFECESINSREESVSPANCSDLVRQVDGHAARSVIGYAAGGVFAGAGAVLLIIDLATSGAETERATSSRPLVLPMVTRSSAGAMMMWRF